MYVQERRGLPKNAYWSPQRTDDWPLMRMKIVKTDDAGRVTRVARRSRATSVFYAWTRSGRCEGCVGARAAAPRPALS